MGVWVLSETGFGPAGKPPAAVVAEMSLLAGLRVREGEATLCWSGSFAEVEGGGAESRFEDDPRTWGSKGWACLAAAMKAASAVIVRPHARHVVSDGPSLKRFLGMFPGARALLDPASMLAPSMLEGRGVEDHLARLYELATEIDPIRLAGVLVSNVRKPLQAGDLPALVPVGDGMVERSALQALAGVIPAAVPRVFLSADPVVVAGWA